MSPIAKVFILILIQCTAVFECVAHITDSKFTIDPEGTYIASDNSFRIDQSKNKDYLFKMWATDSITNYRTLLNRNEETRYMAGFRSTPNEKWLVRMQKTGAGWQTLFLYYK